MITLAGFPLLNQRAAPRPSDRQADENADMNCVPTSLADCILYLTGRLVPPDDLKDAVYGQGTTGGERELTYASYLRSHYGLVLDFEACPSGSLAITSAVRAHLRAGEPVIVTMQSDWARPWGQARWAGTHVSPVSAIDESDDGVMVVNNVWGGFRHVRPVREWAACLGVGVWPVRKVSMANYTTLPDGRFQFGAGIIGVGFAELYVSSGESGDLSIPETYYTPSESFARFTSGHVFHYDARTGKATLDSTGIVVDGLYSAWRTAQAAPASAPADAVFHDAIAALKQALGKLP